MAERFSLEARLQDVSGSSPAAFRVVNLKDTGASLVLPGEVREGSALLVEESLPTIESGTVELRDKKDQGSVQQIWLEYCSGSNVYYCEYLALADRTVPLRYAEVSGSDWNSIVGDGLKGFAKGFLLTLVLGWVLTRKLNE